MKESLAQLWRRIDRPDKAQWLGVLVAMMLVMAVLIFASAAAGSSPFGLFDKPTPSPTPSPSVAPMPSPTPKPTPTPEPKCTDRESVCLLKKYWPGDDAAAMRVANCESNYEPRARNSCCDGLFQLHRRYHAWRAEELGYEWSRDIWDAGKNTRIAWHLRNEQGWSPWECRP